MAKLYGIYGAIVLLTFGYTSQQGYTFGSLFGGQSQQSHQSHSGSPGARTHSYHK